MRKKFLPPEKGFTLLEVVFAVSILAIGMLGYTSLKISNRYSWVFAKSLSQAVQLTGANLEELWMNGYHDSGWMSAGVHSVTVNPDQTLAVVNATSAADQVPPVVSGDFSASGVTWTVREGCPSELTKMVNYTTDWNVGGPKSVTIIQVQVRP